MTTAAAAYTNLDLADLDGDGRLDLAVSESGAPGVRLFRGKGGREFEPPETLGLSDGPSDIALADLDGDGLSDLVTSSAIGRSISVLRNRGAGRFEKFVNYGLGLSPRGHRLADLDGDGALDLAAFDLQSAEILFGRPVEAAPRNFRRGDATGEGDLDVSDPIAILYRIFLGGELLTCEDAADANDDGQLDISDPIAILISLFLGAGPLPPPGSDCGPDPTPDALAECGTGCR